MSGGLAPSKSTVYVSNLPFSLTNNDLHKLFSKYGKVVKVTIVKDKDTRQSKGVAFVLFLDRESAHNCARAVNNKQLFGRTVKASIAIDNGRAAEFIRRRNYTDKSKCYECGDTGHLSYACPKNVLGEREPPKKKEKKKKKKAQQPDHVEEEEESEEEGEDPALDSLSQAIAFQQAHIAEEEEKQKKQRLLSQEDDAHASTSSDSRKPRIKKSAYFSDEEELKEPWSGMGDKRSPTRPKRQPKPSSDEGFWDCSVCTYKNTAEAFKCMMCDVRKGTSTRKPRPVSQLVSQQQSDREPALKKNSHKKMRPRLKNIDRSSAQHLEVTVGDLTVIITDFKEKAKPSSTSATRPPAPRSPVSPPQPERPSSETQRRGRLSLPTSREGSSQRGVH
ncbi:zinc finger CCHC-type and RNA-binding motif-containing protein 1 [Lates japonicus]|uniref:Zinc finger CCHC-type and RNA-binding motif-containing protein 1 n=1 Tax=Lates japonicus TaxID=270547 RepID=A0AAD3RBN9_LATJO|nr:zinc finger CCHC-type and RNA-binding motif-containing protein 1 [Lates japonicus]